MAGGKADCRFDSDIGDHLCLRPRLRRNADLASNPGHNSLSASANSKSLRTGPTQPASDIGFYGDIRSRRNCAKP